MYLKCATDYAQKNRFEVIAWLEQPEPELAAHVVPEIQHRMVTVLEVYADEETILATLENVDDDDADVGYDRVFRYREEDDSDDDDNDATVDLIMSEGGAFLEY